MRLYQRMIHLNCYIYFLLVILHITVKHFCNTNMLCRVTVLFYFDRPTLCFLKVCCSFVSNFFLVNYLTPGRNGLEGKSNPLHLIIIYVTLRFLQGGGTGNLLSYIATCRSVFFCIPHRRCEGTNLSQLFALILKI